ncbi:hypothetical protein [Pseudonocardia acidicola]|uniref:IrrE N-terminal-like domain-containing protein n=1 Tax=Pseudonocardia acidicola TaxID=2724939 RepID=A0ABX1SHU4_9PSEU|nr:hypothetical protein [Pseudonocardia acidicola]NMI00636.1 hypothetical protein [Pseudonocardia acidicola]
MMNELRLRRQCRRLLRDLDIQPPLDMARLCTRIGDYRGRKIILHEEPLEISSTAAADGGHGKGDTSAFGYSFDWGDYDVIVFQKNTSRSHQLHIIFHELGHIICGHIDPDYVAEDQNEAEDDAGAAAAAIAAVALHLPPFKGVVPPRMLRRACYDSSRERLVESIATTFMEWAVMPGHAPQPTPRELGDAQRLYEALSYRRGWL